MIHLLATVLAVRSMTVQTDMGCQVIAKNLLPFFFLSFFFSLYQSISLSTTLSLNLSLPPSLSLSLYQSLSLSLSLGLSLSLSLSSLSVSLSLFLSLSHFLCFCHTHIPTRTLTLSKPHKIKYQHHITLHYSTPYCNLLHHTGTRGDCGYNTQTITACPGIVSCSAHGQCAGSPTYECACSAGIFI